MLEDQVSLAFAKRRIKRSHRLIEGFAIAEGRAESWPMSRYESTWGQSLHLSATFQLSDRGSPEVVLE